MYKIVLLRHGQSDWNQQNRFTGWVDVDLSERGRKEASESGKVLKEAGFKFDLCYTSVLKRAIRTLWLSLEEMDLLWLPVLKSWKLNEKHYGALAGLNKSETAAKYGEAQVLKWRRDFNTCPPMLEKEDEMHPSKDPKYQGLTEEELTGGESLKDTIDRVVPYWEEEIAPQVKSGKNILIAAHGNSLRALVKHLDKMSEEDILKYNIPTGMPLVYELDDDLAPIKKYYLGDEEAVKKAMAEVANQGKSK